MNRRNFFGLIFGSLAAKALPAWQRQDLGTFRMLTGPFAGTAFNAKSINGQTVTFADGELVSFAEATRIANIAIAHSLTLAPGDFENHLADARFRMS